ncbi:hypothetical protein AK812_SmicGene46643 [Symbiodinium microadriaticum]|uniref:Uncharacterized protein n=1 Tax=Symbiodinium microadriaticum TaxID=2951 RepID=A0A1Q9BTN5_SYMMI|nr:hypothetical protein AK812_SmicGene46643 [Symbiodinium microadriaticum]
MRTNLQAAVSTVSLAWLREDRQVKRTAWISWHTVVLASEYARDLRLLQCRLSAAIGHAGHLAYSQQELRSKATLLHVLLSWRAWASKLTTPKPPFHGCSFGFLGMMLSVVEVLCA